MPQTKKSKASPQYKLIYYNSRGRAEQIRWILEYAGVDYEDYRFSPPQWPAIKPTTPFLQAPAMEIDGKLVCQSNAISRYLARQYGLAGEGPMEELLVDMFVDCIEDTRNLVMPIFSEKDPEKKEKLRVAYIESKQLDKQLTRLEELLEDNNGGNGWFVGSKVSWADFLFVISLPWFPLVKVPLELHKYPKLSALNERVVALPQIANWLKRRPDTPI